MTRVPFLLLLAGCAEESSQLFDQLSAEGPLVIAHRGGDDLAPESTVEAFQAAWAAGADVIEVDIRRTTDGVHYLFHDDTLDRTTDGTGSVFDKSWDDLEELDAAYDWTRDGGETYPLRGTGVRIPTLDEMFEAVPDGVWNLDIKSRHPDAVDEVVQIVKAHGAERRVCVGSFDDAIGRQFREALPDACTYYAEGLARWAILGDLLPIDNAPGPRFEILEVPRESAGIEVVTERFVERAHRRGQMVWVWTVNEQSEMERLFGIGVDGVITDEVEVAVGVVSALRTP